MLVRCEGRSAPVNSEEHLVLNNLMLNDQSDDYSFQSDAFNKPDFDLARASCFDNDYAEIGFSCRNNLGYSDVNDDEDKVDEKCRPPKSSPTAADTAQSLNQTNCPSFQQNLTDYKANRSATIVSADPGKFPTYANTANVTSDLTGLETHLNGNFQPNNNDNPNEASNESESINNLDLIEAPDHCLSVDGLQLNETLLNALLSNQIVAGTGSQLNGILRKNKMVSSCLSSIGNSISGGGRFPLSGELIGPSEMKSEVKHTVNVQLAALDGNHQESDCSNKLNSISIKLAENDDGSTNVLFARNLDGYLLLSSSAECTSPAFVQENGCSAICEPETNLATTANTFRKRPNKLKPNEQILQLTNSLSMPIASSNCLNLSPNRQNSSNFHPLNSSSASSDSNCLNLLYSLANNISNSNQFASDRKSVV